MTADLHALAAVAAFRNEVLPHTHPIVRGRVLVPGALFTARNRISGRTTTFRYSGTMSTTSSGDRFVAAIDARGNARSVPVAAIISVRPTRRVTS